MPRDRLPGIALEGEEAIASVQVCPLFPTGRKPSLDHERTEQTIRLLQLRGIGNMRRKLNPRRRHRILSSETFISLFSYGSSVGVAIERRLRSPIHAPGIARLMELDTTSPALCFMVNYDHIKSENEPADLFSRSRYALLRERLMKVQSLGTAYVFQGKQTYVIWLYAQNRGSYVEAVKEVEQFFEGRVPYRIERLDRPVPAGVDHPRSEGIRVFHFVRPGFEDAGTRALRRELARGFHLGECGSMDREMIYSEEESEAEGAE